jgi:DNA-directed RNA polymerase III subunit RPC4
MGEMLFFQFPSSLPLRKQESSAKKGKGIEDKRRPIHGKGFKLEEMPPGYMGKLLVHKSGAVKLKIGEILFNVRHSVPCVRPILYLFGILFYVPCILCRYRLAWTV